MSDKLLKAEEIALLVGISTQTLNNWYRWKKLNANHPLAVNLPNYIQDGDKQTRYWKQTDAWLLINFKNAIPRGRNGILGDVTQKYVKNRKV